MDYNLNWTNCLLFLTGLNETREKKSENWREKMTYYGLKILRVILITVYIHLTGQMLGLALMGIYLQHSRLPLLVWYYFATVQSTSAVQWFLMMERKDRSNSQLHLMTRILPMKRRKFIRTTDCFFSGTVFFLLIFTIIVSSFSLLSLHFNDLVQLLTTNKSDNSAVYVHKFVIPSSEIASLAVLISTKLHASFFHIHLHHVCETIKERITGLNSEKKERLIRRFLEWVGRREEAIERFSPLVSCWSINLLASFVARNLHGLNLHGLNLHGFNLHGFEKTIRLDLFSLKLLLLFTLFLFFGSCACLSQRSFNETRSVAIKFLTQKKEKNNNKSTTAPEDDLLQLLTEKVIQKSYILSLLKCKLLEINNNLPFKLFLTFLLIYLIPSMFSNK